jgi:hypothetical protein
MPIIDETKESLRRFKTYADQLIELCGRHEIKGWRAPLQLVRVYRSNSAFRNEWNSILARAAQVDGGKIGFGAAMGILGLVLGGVGVAGAWGAVGIPLVAILVPLGFLAGNEVDQYRNPKGVAEVIRPSQDSELCDELRSAPITGDGVEILFGSAVPPLADIVTMIRVLGECYADVAAVRQQIGSFSATTEALREKLDQTQKANDRRTENLESRCKTVEDNLKESRDMLLSFEGKSLAAQRALQNALAASQTEVGRLKTAVRWMLVALVLVAIASGLGITFLWLHFK